MDTHDHWNTVFGTKGERDVSWFEPYPAESLRMIEHAGLTPATCLIDVGGGESRLVDELIARGLTCLVALDISEIALRRARERLGDAGRVVTWIAASVTGEWTAPPMDIWHDRAVFHFLVDPADRATYRQRLLQTLKPGGAAIIATFALDGPERCSGLPVARYSPESLAAELGEGFTLVESTSHMHQTPWGTPQSFQYSRFARARLLG